MNIIRKINPVYKVKPLLCALALCIAASIAGCASKESGEAVETAGEGQYYVYYRDKDNYELKALICDASQESRQESIRFLYELLKNPDNSELANAVPKDLELVSIYVDDGTLTMNFASGYTQMSPANEILCREAIVKTMLQVDGVEGVIFNVAEQPLASGSGRTIGVMTADSFEDSINQSLKETEITLYFANEKGDGLLAESRTIVYRSGEGLEELVIEELIEGPDASGHYPVLDSSLQVSDVSVSDGICYVYFESDFMQNSLEVEDYIPVYAIVNSLSELSSVSRVQFVIEGISKPSFRGTISLENSLSRNQDYIKQEE